MTTLFENVNFKSSSGTANRTPAARWNDTFNVKDFGAVGDGSTDDTTAIQAAVTAALAVNGTVYFPATANNYKVSSSINALFTTVGGIKFIGDGYGSHIKGNVAPDSSTVTFVTTTLTAVSGFTTFPSNNAPIWFVSSGTLPNGITGAGQGLLYYVVNSNSGAGTFGVATTPGGAAISLSGGSGTLTARRAGSGHILNIQNLGTDGPYLISDLYLDNSNTTYPSGCVFLYGLVGSFIQRCRFNGFNCVIGHGNCETQVIQNCDVQGNSNHTSGSYGVYSTGSNADISNNIFQGHDECVRLNGGGYVLNNNRFETNNAGMVLGLDDSTAAGVSGSVADLFSGGCTFEACGIGVDCISIAGTEIVGFTIDATSNSPSTPSYGIRVRSGGNSRFGSGTVSQADRAFSTACISIEGNPADLVFEGVTIALNGQGGTGWNLAYDARFSPYFIECNHGQGNGYTKRSFANAPTSPQTGMFIVFTDSTTNTLGANVTTGGGTSVVLTWYNGANYTVVGK